MNAVLRTEPATTERVAARRDAGFTLPELLLSIVIIGIIAAGIGAGLVTVLRNYQSAQRRSGGAADAQVLATWLVPDVQSAALASTDVNTAPATSSGCSSSVPAGSSNVLRLSWADTSGANTMTAAYRAQQDGTDWHLVRYFCVNGGTANTVRVVRHLQDATAATVINTGSRLGLSVTTSVEGQPYAFTVSGTRRASSLAAISPPTSNPPN